MREMVHEFDHHENHHESVHCNENHEEGEDDLNENDEEEDTQNNEEEVEIESNFTQEQAVRDVYDREIPLEMYFLQLQFGNPGHAYYSQQQQQYEHGMMRYDGGFRESW